jgi:hypothetical protein
MDETEWLSTWDQLALLEYAVRCRASRSERKCRLFGAACCRRVWFSLISEDSMRAVEAAEFFADGLIGDDALRSHYQRADAAWRAVWREQECSLSQRDAAGAAALIAGSEVWYYRSAGASAARSAAVYSTTIGPCRRDKGECAAQANLLRDIFGNPFRPFILDGSLLNDAVIGLAHAIYEDRAWDRMPILADALEEAGCTEAAILDHCRSEGRHVRGCWVVDFLLGKE